MNKLLDTILLPREITQFERSYLARVNRVALVFFALHVPVFAAVAWANHTRPSLAVALTLAVLAGPALAVRSLSNPRGVSVVHGIAAMCFGGLLVHFGQGPMQIEMHFYFFALVAMCSVFGNPMVILAATATVAMHHLLVWLLLPASVFNYDAAWWVVGVHAVFVVLEAVATCFIARSFFDNVIGLERIVASRTIALDAKNRDMRVLLDNVQQGFLTIDRDGRLAAERSAAVDRWLGAPAEGALWFEHLSRVAPDFAAATRLPWAEVADGVMPVEVTLDQMPRAFTMGGTHYRVEYRPIGDAEAPSQFLVIVTDVTTEVERELAETERRETMTLFERLLADRSVVEAFFEESGNLVDSLRRSEDPVVVKRMLHTLKGNSSLFGLNSVAAICHALEDVLVDEGRLPTPAEYGALFERWAVVAADVQKLLGSHRPVAELDEAQLGELLAAVQNGEPKDALARRIRRLKLEPAGRRLRHFADQARRIASRLDRGDIEVQVDDGGVRLDPRKWGGFWGAFIHAVRNAVDHGLEPAEDRVAAGKPEHGTLALRAREDAGRVIIEIADDGRGIDWEAVAERALRMGAPATTPDELKRALFMDGVSTAAQVTDVSGRGVGMGALLEGARALGGDVTVETRRGAGTTLRMTFPLRGSSPSLRPVPNASATA